MYLSNTGAKDGEAVRQKLRGAPYRLQTELIPKGLVYTAAEAQCALHATNPNPHPNLPRTLTRVRPHVTSILSTYHSQTTLTNTTSYYVTLTACAAYLPLATHAGVPSWP